MKKIKANVNLSKNLIPESGRKQKVKMYMYMCLHDSTKSGLCALWSVALVVSLLSRTLTAGTYSAMLIQRTAPWVI